MELKMIKDPEWQLEHQGPYCFRVKSKMVKRIFIYLELNFILLFLFEIIVGAFNNLSMENN